MRAAPGVPPNAPVDGLVVDGGREAAFGQQALAVDLAHAGVVDEVVLAVDGGHLDALFQLRVQHRRQHRLVEIGHHDAERAAAGVEHGCGDGPADVTVDLDRRGQRPVWPVAAVRNHASPDGLNDPFDRLAETT